MCDTIEIYVACLESYNAGEIHGIWIDASKPTKDIYDDIRAMLQASPIPNAEEFEIHDINNPFDYNVISTNQDIEDIHEIAVFLQEHGNVGAALLEEVNSNLDKAKSLMKSSYQGQFDATTEFARNMAQETFNIDGPFLMYLDIEKYWHSLRAKGYFAVNVGYTVHIFSPC